MNIQDSCSCPFDKKKIIAISVIVLLAAGCLLLDVLNAPPTQFPVKKIITIEKGKVLNEISQDFKTQKLIRSSLWLETVAWFLKKETKIKAGDYFFEKPLSVINLLGEITKDENRSESIKVTVPEGSTIEDIVKIFKDLGFDDFSIEDKALEGYLFPDTYFVSVNISSDQVVTMMRENFDEKTTQEMKERDIVIMASLLEKEAATEEDRKLISGILWKRLDAKMPLQVDAVFPYIIGKYSLQLTLEDLKVDSPYNTYLYKGLPPGPIANPGLESFEAALDPTDSSYWFYLSDKESKIHYSVTYDEHLIKKERYLK